MRVAIKEVPSIPRRQEPQQQIPLIDNMLAPEIFVTGISGFSNMSGIIAIALEAARCDHARTPAAFERVVVGRLVLTAAAAQNLVASLNDFLEQQGLSPSDAVVGRSTRQ